MNSTRPRTDRVNNGGGQIPPQVQRIKLSGPSRTPPGPHVDQQPPQQQQETEGHTSRNSTPDHYEPVEIGGNNREGAQGNIVDYKMGIMGNGGTDAAMAGSYVPDTTPDKPGRFTLENTRAYKNAVLLDKHY
ncbi:hypothetical protein P691DRAFT_780693 [Macrolepiota fuliginosa MF-IS2]|uniref:Uncharacterized protein n=1 Tax=Macrolepiota fuliginosa MF-IS2 TaxID=1400762 RepID=A0A9P5WZ90_9AGAR|nr:hypothetical protein P691DRAFT_780693 [Macrolepiota fuliginosa MF-IS2]